MLVVFPIANSTASLDHSVDILFIIRNICKDNCYFPMFEGRFVECSKDLFCSIFGSFFFLK